MTLCHGQMFFDAFFARDHLHLSRAGYNVLAKNLLCYIHTFSTKTSADLHLNERLFVFCWLAL